MLLKHQLNQYFNAVVPVYGLNCDATICEDLEEVYFNQYFNSYNDRY